MKGVYLCAREHRIKGYDIDYNDIIAYDGINLLCSCEDVDLKKYDFIIATPPCNYYSRANYRRDISSIALATRHLLPYCLKAAMETRKPFLIENVVNASLLPQPSGCFAFVWGEHTFYTNVFFARPPRSFAVRQYKADLPWGHRDGNENVDIIIRCFLEAIHG